MGKPLTSQDIEALSAFVSSRDAPGYYAQLESWGYAYGELAGEVANDGSKTRPATRTAIESFQRSYGLPFDGEVSPALLNALKTKRARRGQ